MPTYEFRCPDGSIIERIFKMSDVPDEIPSPNGDGMATRMISGGAGLLFKGTGFYITDYGKDGKKDQRAASGESKGESKGDAKSETKSESKSESKSDSAGTAPAKAAESSAPKESKKESPKPSAPESKS